MILSRDYRICNFCVNESKFVTPVAGAKVFACLAIKNKILSVGYSSSQSNPFQKKHSKNDAAIYLHAENMAIWKAIRLGIDLRYATLYVARTLRNGSQALALPCSGCMQAIVHYNVKKIIYTTATGVLEYERV